MIISQWPERLIEPRARRTVSSVKALDIVGVLPYANTAISVYCSMQPRMFLRSVSAIRWPTLAMQVSQGVRTPTVPMVIVLLCWVGAAAPFAWPASVFSTWRLAVEGSPTWALPRSGPT
jgi:hypothetical protein